MLHCFIQLKWYCGKPMDSVYCMYSMISISLRSVNKMRAGKNAWTLQNNAGGVPKEIVVSKVETCLEREDGGKVKTYLKAACVWWKTYPPARVSSIC